MSSVSPSATADEKLDFVFRMYDWDSDGNMDWNECKMMVRDVLTWKEHKVSSDKQLDELVGTLFEQLDWDGDQTISAEEFRTLAKTWDLNLIEIHKAVLKMTNTVAYTAMCNKCPYSHN